MTVSGRKIDDVNVVVDTETSAQNFVLGQDGKITGTVMNFSKEPIEGAFIAAIGRNDVNEGPNLASIPATTDAALAAAILTGNPSLIERTMEAICSGCDYYLEFSVRR